MSAPAAPQAAPPKKGGWLRPILVGVLGIGGGVVATYTTAVVDRIAKPPKPVANFATAADGLTLTCQNQASGESGWWDFGDGTALEPFTPGQPAVTHTYTKPGNFTVKLTVRNFIAEENERSVPVEVSAAGKDAANPPQVLGFAVQPVSPVSVAPATFRVTAEVTNAKHCVWDFGDGRLEVADGGGKIDRLVTFEKPGAFPVQLVAHNGKAAAKQAAAVKVETPAAGTLMAVLKVTDSGTRVERASHTETVAVPAPKDKAPAGAFGKTITARAGFALVEAAPVNPSISGVKSLKVQIAADKRSATVSGEWAEQKGGKPAGSDLLIPVKLTEERTFPARSATIVVTGLFLGVPGQAGSGAASLPLPPVPAGLTGHKRDLMLEVRQFAQTGPANVLKTVPMAPQPAGKPMWSEVVMMGPTPYQFQAKQDGDAVRVSYAGR